MTQDDVIFDLLLELFSIICERQVIGLSSVCHVPTLRLGGGRAVTVSISVATV